MEIYPSADMQRMLADFKMKIFVEAFFYSRIFYALPDSAFPERKYFQKNAPFNHN